MPERPQPVVDEARPGEVIGGRYELMREIGRGAFGQVFLARDRATESRVALKLFARRQSANAVKRLRREVNRAPRDPSRRGAHLRSRRGRRAAVCVDGVCRRRDAVGAPRPRAAADGERAGAGGADLARALAAAHRVGVVHRDLKPANILLRASNKRPVIVDFGISRHNDDLAGDDAITRDGQVIGTPRYMPPEQLLARDVGPAADLYAWGLVVFEMAMGRTPHAGKTATQLAVERAARRRRPRLDARRSAAGAGARGGALSEADPALRPADGEALKAESPTWAARRRRRASRGRRRRGIAACRAVPPSCCRSRRWRRSGSGGGNRAPFRATIAASSFTPPTRAAATTDGSRAHSSGSRRAGSTSASRASAWWPATTPPT